MALKRFQRCLKIIILRETSAARKKLVLHGGKVENYFNENIFWSGHSQAKCLLSLAVLTTEPYWFWIHNVQARVIRDPFLTSVWNRLYSLQFTSQKSDDSSLSLIRMIRFIFVNPNGTSISTSSDECPLLCHYLKNALPGCKRKHWRWSNRTPSVTPTIYTKYNEPSWQSALLNKQRRKCGWLGGNEHFVIGTNRFAFVVGWKGNIWFHFIRSLIHWYIFISCLTVLVCLDWTKLYFPRSTQNFSSETRRRKNDIAWHWNQIKFSLRWLWDWQSRFFWIHRLNFDCNYFRIERLPKYIKQRRELRKTSRKAFYFSIFSSAFVISFRRKCIKLKRKHQKGNERRWANQSFLLSVSLANGDARIESLLDCIFHHYEILLDV